MKSCRVDYQKDLLKNRIVSFYYRRVKKIIGPFCKYDLAKIEAFVESVRDFLIFDIFQYLLDYILISVGPKGKSCFNQLRFVNCLNYSIARKRVRVFNFEDIFPILGYGKDNLLFRVVCGSKDFVPNYFYLYVVARSYGLMVRFCGFDSRSVEALGTIEDEIEDKIYDFNFKKNNVWIRVSTEGLECIFL